MSRSVGDSGGLLSLRREGWAEGRKQEVGPRAIEGSETRYRSGTGSAAQTGSLWREVLQSMEGAVAGDGAGAQTSASQPVKGLQI